MSNNPSTVPHGNVKNEWNIAVQLSPTTVNPATTVEQTFAVTGVHLGDFVSAVKPTAQPGLGIVNSRVSANDVLALTFINVSATTTVVPTASETYIILVNRPENFNLAGSFSALQIP
jgi:hypothetical protein